MRKVINFVLLSSFFIQICNLITLYSRLVDLMKKNKNLGAACGRIHPTGGGFMTWYQKYEYAIGHWMQKATEHVLGCVLCSPGCFSLFRGSALMDFNVMRMYTKVSELPMHFIQYDQVNDAPFFDRVCIFFSKNCMKKLVKSQK